MKNKSQAKRSNWFRNNFKKILFWRDRVGDITMFFHELKQITLNEYELKFYQNRLIADWCLGYKQYGSNDVLVVHINGAEWQDVMNYIEINNIKRYFLSLANFENNIDSITKTFAKLEMRDKKG